MKEEGAMSYTGRKLITYCDWEKKMKAKLSLTTPQENIWD
jgi:hypothetical protein